MTTKKTQDGSSSLNPGLLSSVFEQYTASGARAMHGGSLFELRTVDVQMPPCGVFVEPFVLTIQELSGAAETAAMERAAARIGVGGELAKTSMQAINGEPITLEKRDFIWEGVGMKGRRLVILAFGRAFDEMSIDETEAFLSSIPRP